MMNSITWVGFDDAAKKINVAVFLGNASQPHEEFTVDNDPSGLTIVPAVVTGLCVTVEVVNLGYIIGRGIDRRNAERAAAARQP